MPLLIMNIFAALALIHASCLTLTRLKTDAETSVHHYQQTTQLYNYDMAVFISVKHHRSGGGDEESLGGRQPNHWTTWKTYL